MACSIGQKIFCVHAGIGSRINRIADIDALKRPVIIPEEVTTQDQQIGMDLLWSDPTEETGIVPHTERDPSGSQSIVKFGPD